MRFVIGMVLTAGCLGGKDGEDTADTTGEGAATCDSWTGYVDGRQWTYAYPKSSSSDGGWTSTVTVDAGAVTLTQVGDQDNSQAQVHTEANYGYRCDADGLWLLTGDTTTTSVVDGVETQSWIQGTWDSEGPVQPPRLTMGDTWAWGYTYTYTSSDGDGGYEGDVDYRAEVEEEIEVPAGTYAAMRVFQSADQGASGRSWFADGVGLVATDTVELVEVD